MPIYEYVCKLNQQRIEVMHSIHEKIETWQELCDAAGLSVGDVPGDTPVKKVIHAPGLAFPKTTSELKNLGFTKLVKREKGVYENVTATGNEKRYMKSDDPSSFPDLKRKISD